MSMFFQTYQSESYTLVNYTATDGKPFLYKFPAKHFINFINDNSLRNDFYNLLGKANALKLDLEKEINQSTEECELKQKKLLFTTQLIDMLVKGNEYTYYDGTVWLQGLCANTLCDLIGYDSVQQGSTSRTRQLRIEAVDVFNTLSKLNTVPQFKNDHQKSINYRNITAKFTVMILHPSKECLNFVSTIGNSNIIIEFFALIHDIYNIEKEKTNYKKCMDIEQNVQTLAELKDILTSGNFDEKNLGKIDAFIAVSPASNTATSYISFDQIKAEKTTNEGKMRLRIESILDRAHKFAENIRKTTQDNSYNNSSLSSSPTSSPLASPASSQRSN